MPTFSSNSLVSAGETNESVVKKILAAITGDGTPQLKASDSFLDIARGNVTGASSVNKFGRSSDLDTSVNTDIWSRANSTDNQVVWTAPTEARLHSIVSTSDEDSGPDGVVAEGTGAKTIRVYGLTSWSTTETSEDLTLDGTTAVNTSNSYVIIHRLQVLTSGSNANGPNVGQITATAATDATVTAQIEAAEGQTQMAIYGISSADELYLVDYYASIVKGGGSAAVAIDFLVNTTPDVQLNNFRLLHSIGIENSGSSYARQEFTPYLKVTGPAILKVRGNSTSNNQFVDAGFDAIKILV